jgi:hydroxyacylglutathione hydrolase
MENTMPGILIKKSVGPWPMNAYVVICEETKSSVIIDPGAEANQLLELISGTKALGILITHGHLDHIQALSEVASATNAPIYIHPEDAKANNLYFDVPLSDGQVIHVGNLSITVIHTPGHTPGQVCFDLGDGRIIVGDTIFVGGPGKTWSPEEFKRTMQTMQEIVFAWLDETEFFPGHGPSGYIGKERPAFEAFVERGWPETLYGDVTWDI